MINLETQIIHLTFFMSLRIDKLGMTSDAACNL